MKKIVILLILAFATYSSTFALDKTTCTKPCVKDFNCKFQTGAPTQTGTGTPVTGYTCGTAADAGGNAMKICGYIAHGGIYSDHSVHNCLATGAPVNSGLIFLIIAGGGLGFFFLRKQQKAKGTLAV